MDEVMLAHAAPRCRLTRPRSTPREGDLFEQHGTERCGHPLGHPVRRTYRLPALAGTMRPGPDRLPRRGPVLAIGRSKDQQCDVVFVGMCVCVPQDEVGQVLRCCRMVPGDQPAEALETLIKGLSPCLHQAVGV